jgi:F-type H+-transporting ATPase subunit c
MLSTLLTILLDVQPLGIMGAAIGAGIAALAAGIGIGKIGASKGRNQAHREIRLVIS